MPSTVHEQSHYGILGTTKVLDILDNTHYNKYFYVLLAMVFKKTLNNTFLYYIPKVGKTLCTIKYQTTKKIVETNENA